VDFISCHPPSSQIAALSAVWRTALPPVWWCAASLQLLGRKKVQHLSVCEKEECLGEIKVEEGEM